jgi:RNA polymerase sigma-70 factor (ECF subfamily)
VNLADRGAFAAFYGSQADRLLAYVVRRVYDHDLAMDLTAETFAVAYLKRGRFRGSSRAEAEAWLFKIASRNITRYRRRGVAERKAIQRLGLEVPRLDDADIERLHDMAGTRKLRAVIAEELRSLSADQQEALSLRIVEELPYPEVAARLGVSEQAARARVSRGLARLGESIEGAGALT